MLIESTFHAPRDYTPTLSPISIAALTSACLNPSTFSTIRDSNSRPKMHASIHSQFPLILQSTTFFSNSSTTLYCRRVSAKLLSPRRKKK